MIKRLPKVNLNNEKSFLIIGFLIGLILRLYAINSPLLDKQGYRQCHTAMQARNFYRHGFNILKPEIDGNGSIRTIGPGEFPLFPFLVAVGYKIFGVKEWFGRFINIVFSLFAALMLYFLVKKYYGVTIAKFSFIIFLILPYGIYFSRTFQRYSMVLCFLISLVYFFSNWLDNRRLYDLLLSILFGILSFLVQPPSVYIGIVLIYLAYRKFGVKIFLKVELWVFSFIVLLFPVLWIVYFKNNFGGVFTESMHNWLILTHYTKWLNFRFIERTMFVYPSDLALTAVGYILFIAGLFVKNNNKVKWTFYFWLLGLYIYFALELYFTYVVLHPYYYYQLVPIASVFVGKTLSELWNRKVFKKYGKLLTVVSLFLIFVSGVLRIRKYYNVNWTYFKASKVARISTEKHSIIITNIDSPEILYYADRRGWFISNWDDVKTRVNDLKKRGAQYFVFLYNKEKSNKQLEKYLKDNFNLLVQEKEFLIFNIT